MARLGKPKAVKNGARFGGETLTFVPADCNLRPLRDVIVVEPCDVRYSSTLWAPQKGRTFRGIVRAVGPGTYPAYYLDADGDRIPDWKRTARKARAHGETFVPTVVKVGDVVELGGHNEEIEGYSFTEFVWGDKLMIWAQEADVAGIVEAQAA